MKILKLYFDNGGWDDQNSLYIEGSPTGISISPISTMKAMNPSEKDWEIFLNKLKELKIHEWKKYYENPEILDGHQWGFEFHTDEFSIHTEGSNGYPGLDPKETVFDYEGSLFPSLEKAIEKLIGEKSKE